ncbi:hypothetical protein [Streptomyces smyrnaeus]|uniref:hypothetical protein n=1 Tax=Streptomyces smyrnaeus TaxID=1387713 RepID=UPI0033FD567B
MAMLMVVPLAAGSGSAAAGEAGAGEGRERAADPPPISSWGSAYNFTPLLEAGGIAGGLDLSPTTTVVLYNNTSHTLKLSTSYKTGEAPQWSTGNGVDGEFPYGVPPVQIEPGAGGRIQMINKKLGGVGGGVTYYAVNNDKNHTYFASLDFDNWVGKKNNYTVKLVTWQQKRPGHSTPDGPKLNIGLINDEGKTVSTNQKEKHWNADTFGKGMAPIIGMVFTEPYETTTYPALGSRPSKKEEACNNYRRLARSYGAKRQKLETMWKSGRIGAIAGAWLGMAYACTDW